MPRPHFTPGKDPVPILQEAGWAPGPVWTGGKSRPHKDSIPDHPAGSQSLYRLSYQAHNPEGVIKQNSVGKTVFMSSVQILHFTLIIIYVLQVNFHFFEQYRICVLVDYIKLGWSRCLCGQRCRSAVAWLLLSLVRIMLRAWMFVSSVVCHVSSSGLFQGSPTRCVCVIVRFKDLKVSWSRPDLGCSTTEK